MKISIIMPSYNQGSFIRESIDSVLNQEWPEIELIVIDGGSTDETVDILKSYGDRIAYWVSEPDEGQSDALNKGLAQTTGEMVGWMNADDVYLPQAFSSIAKSFERHQGVDFVYGSNVILDESGSRLGVQVAFPFSVNQLLYEGFHCFTQSFFWRRESVSGKYQFPKNLHRTMDFHFFAWIGLNYPNSSFLCLPKLIGGFRRHADQKTSTDGGDKVNVEYKWIDHDLQVKSSRLNRNQYKRLPYRLRRLWYYAKVYTTLKRGMET